MGKKYNEIQLTKNKKEVNNRKMKNHRSSPKAREQQVSCLSIRTRWCVGIT